MHNVEKIIRDTLNSYDDPSVQVRQKVYTLARDIYIRSLNEYENISPEARQKMYANLEDIIENVEADYQFKAFDMKLNQQIKVSSREDEPSIDIAPEGHSTDLDMNDTDFSHLSIDKPAVDGKRCANENHNLKREKKLSGLSEVKKVKKEKIRPKRNKKRNWLLASLFLLIVVSLLSLYYNIYGFVRPVDGARQSLKPSSVTNLGLGWVELMSFDDLSIFSAEGKGAEVLITNEQGRQVVDFTAKSSTDYLFVKVNEKLAKHFKDNNVILDVVVKNKDEQSGKRLEIKCNFGTDTCEKPHSFSLTNIRQDFLIETDLAGVDLQQDRWLRFAIAGKTGGQIRLYSIGAKKL